MSRKVYDAITLNVMANAGQQVDEKDLNLEVDTKFRFEELLNSPIDSSDSPSIIYDKLNWKYMYYFEQSKEGKITVGYKTRKISRQQVSFIKSLLTVSMSSQLEFIIINVYVLYQLYSLLEDKEIAIIKYEDLLNNDFKILSAKQIKNFNIPEIKSVCNKILKEINTFIQEKKI